MPKGHHYTSDVKSLIFRIIKFIESEKEGPVIPMYNVNDRLMNMLNISHGALFSLKQELTTIIEDQTKAKRISRSAVTVGDEVELPKPISPKKHRHSSRPNIILSEYGNEVWIYSRSLWNLKKPQRTL